MQIAGAVAIIIMAVVGGIGIFCIYIYEEDREDEGKPTFLAISIFSLTAALALSMAAWVFMSEVT